MGSICPTGKVQQVSKPITRYYLFGKRLGGGFFGNVYESVRLEDSSLKFAIKTIKKKEKSDELFEEIGIFKKLDHPYIVKLFEVFEDQQQIHLVMECCDQGDLFDKVNLQKQISEFEAKDIVRKILLAVNYLHSCGIVHRDLKPENILFQGTELKLIDFGLSKRFVKQVTNDKNENFMKTLVGTVQYLAPEILRGKYDQKCDMWSIGVITYYMLSGVLPFVASNNKDCFKKILKGEFTFADLAWKEISSRAKKFICQLLKKNPQKRISAKQALRHKWLIVEVPVNISYSFVFTLKSMYSKCEFKKFAVIVLVKYLATEEVKEITEAFFSINESKTGIICMSELEKAIKKADPNIEVGDLYKFFVEHGKITFSNFVAAAIFTRPVSESLVQKGFRVLSIGGNGFITPSSLMNALKYIGKPMTMRKAARLISSLDPEKFERFSYKEFKTMFNSSFRSKSH